MFRLLSRLFLLLAVVAVAIDLWWLGTGAPPIPSLVAGDEAHFATLGEWWVWIDADSLQMLQPAIERHVHPFLWDPVIFTLLQWPLAAELAVLGVLFRLLARPRGHGV